MLLLLFLDSRPWSLQGRWGFKVFLLDAFKIAFEMKHLTYRWVQSGYFFLKSKHFYSIFKEGQIRPPSSCVQGWIVTFPAVIFFYIFFRSRWSTTFRPVYNFTKKGLNSRCFLQSFTKFCTVNIRYNTCAQVSTSWFFRII